MHVSAGLAPPKERVVQSLREMSSLCSKMLRTSSDKMSRSFTEFWETMQAHSSQVRELKAALRVIVVAELAKLEAVLNKLQHTFAYDLLLRVFALGFLNSCCIFCFLLFAFCTF